MYHRMRYGNAVVVAVAALWVAVSCSNSTEPLIPDPDKAPAEYTKYLVDQAVSRYKTEGREATLAYYNSPESADGEWYVSIHDENDVIIAHPRSELLGRTRDQRIDANGHDYGAEFASATRTAIMAALVSIGSAVMLGAARPARPGGHDSTQAELISIEEHMSGGHLEGAIRLAPGRTVRVEKVPVSDCRVGRGFIHYPVDGRLDTRNYNNGWGEHPSWVYSGTQYEFNEANGLHITLADAKGFDAVLFRGDYRGVMYQDAGDFYPGPGAKKICDVSNPGSAFRRIFPERLNLSRVDLFYAGERTRSGDLCDASFLRIEHGAPSGSGTGLVVTGPASGSEVFQRWVTERFGEGGRLFALGTGEAQTLSFDGREFVHLLTPLQDPAQGLDAVTFRWTVEALDGPTLLTFRIQDPLDPRREIMGVDCVVDKPGAYEVTLDFPNQVFLPADLGEVELIYGPPLVSPARLWLSIGAERSLTLAGLRVTLECIPREEALPQAIAWRKLLLKGQFYVMSEPRPWMGLYAEVEKRGGGKVDIREWLTMLADTGKRGRRYRVGLESLFETVEQCRVLAPEDDIVRQYHEWIFQAITRSRPWKATLPETPGAPRWAVMLHEAWLGARSIPEWWIENRLAPESGEIGERVNDDGDMYQQWASYPFVEDAPLGAAIRDAGAKLADLAIKRYLSEDYLNIFKHSPHHSYEEGINQLATNAWWNYGDPVHYERAMRAADSIRKLTVKAGCGHIHFRALKMEANDLYAPGPLGEAGHTHALLLHPAYEVAWYNRNPAAVDFYSQWADGWIEHQEPGNYATVIDVKTGRVVMAEKTAVGGGGYRSQGIAWLGIYEVTKDPRFLKPFMMAVDAGDSAIVSHYAADFVNASPFLEHLREKGKLALLPTYAYYVATGKTDRLEESLEAAVAEWQRFGYMYTAAEPYSDRVFPLPFKEVFDCYLGSYAARNIFPHNFAVSYEGLGKDFAALVGPSDETSLKVRFYSFAGKSIQGRMRVWRLEHGRYKVRVGPDANNDGVLDAVEKEEVMVLHRHAPIALTLPPRRQTIIEVEQVERLDDLLDRPDLALSPLDSTCDVFSSWQYESLLRIRVHNIGARAAENVEVALIREGEKIQSIILSKLEAPLDLKPRVAVVHFTNAQVGDEIVVDPKDAIPEIAKHNNRLIVQESGFVRPRG